MKDRERNEGAPAVRLEVERELADLPVIDYLGVLWPDRSKAGLRELFARGAVRSKGRPVSPEARAGDASPLELHADAAGLPSIHVSKDEAASGVKVLHEDERLTVVDKPAGVPVIPDRSRAGPSCLGFLIERELQSRAGRPLADYRRARVVHRLDRQTSGVVLLARTLAAEVEISRWFEAGDIEKRYLALVTGTVAPARIDVNVPIGPGRRGKMRAVAEGKESFTQFEVVERFDCFTLVRARPRTGRMHQIRVHAWAMGHPLAVDPLYRVGEGSRGPAPPAIHRLTLHAERIVLPAAWGEPREFRAPLPADFAAALEALRQA